MEFLIKHLNPEMIPTVVNSLYKFGIHRSREYFEKCLDEQLKGIRTTLGIYC